jgi:hypothetical protein
MRPTAPSVRKSSPATAFRAVIFEGLIVRLANAKALSGQRSRSVQAACYAAHRRSSAGTTVYATRSTGFTPVCPEHPNQKRNNENAGDRDFSIGVTFHHRAKHKKPGEP